MSKENNNRSELKVFNRVIGTCSGWDEVDNLHLVFYDFEPNEGSNMPKHDLNVDYFNGLFLNYDNHTGDVILSKDFLTVMNGFVARQLKITG